MRQQFTNESIGELVTLIDLGGYKKATKFWSPRFVVKATRQGERDLRAKQVTVLITLGRPNYVEREFIKKATKAKEPFPIKKIQLKLDGKENG